MSNISILDAVKVQARAVIPITKALEAELGKKKAHDLVERAIAESYADFLAKKTSERNTHPGESSQDLEYPVDSEVVEHTDKSFAVNMTKCAFADYFLKIGEPEIGD